VCNSLNAKNESLRKWGSPKAFSISNLENKDLDLKKHEYLKRVGDGQYNRVADEREVILVEKPFDNKMHQYENRFQNGFYDGKDRNENRGFRSIGALVRRNVDRSNKHRIARQNHRKYGTLSVKQSFKISNKVVDVIINNGIPYNDFLHQMTVFSMPDKSLPKKLSTYTTGNDSSNSACIGEWDHIGELELEVEEAESYLIPELRTQYDDKHFESDDESENTPLLEFGRF